VIFRAGSLQRALTVTVITIVGVALTTLSETAYWFHSRGSRERFDERLTEVARAATLLVGRDGIPPSDLEADLFPPLDQTRGATSIQIWNEDGSVLARDPPQASIVLSPPPPGSPRFETVPLPEGGTGRLYRAWLELGPNAPAASAPRRLGVAVVRDTARLERRLARLRRILWATTMGTMLFSGLVVSLVIRRSVRGVARLSSRIGSIDALSLGERLDVAGLPDELRPAFAKVNELLSRIEQVLNRERQFSADVSHELRTPLAGLRTILEVSGSRERTASEHRAALEDSLEVVRQLEAIVENLLALARLGAHLTEEHQEEIDVGVLVNSCFRPLSGSAGRRGLRFDNWVGPATSIVADGIKLRLITANLISNAVQYTAEGGWITVESEPARGVVLRVRDSGPAIPEGALARIFDPFFRVERSRSGDGEHCGIGLTLVRGLCEVCGYRVSAENEPGGAVTFTIASQPSSTARLDKSSSPEPSAGTGTAAGDARAIGRR
jgi:signal transduction histidine kinase